MIGQSEVGWVMMGGIKWFGYGLSKTRYNI